MCSGLGKYAGERGLFLPGDIVSVKIDASKMHYLHMAELPHLTESNLRRHYDLRLKAESLNASGIFHVMGIALDRLLEEMPSTWKIHYRICLPSLGVNAWIQSVKLDLVSSLDPGSPFSCRLDRLPRILSKGCS